MIKQFVLVGAAVGAFITASSATAAVELITNGNFSSTFTTGSQPATTPSQLNYNGYGVTGWTSANSSNGDLGYNFLFNPTLAGSAAYTSNGQYGNIQLFTSANGGSATAPASLVSPTGGNFLAMDSAFQVGGISQIVNGLTIGAKYQLTFYWGASQQAGFTGVTTDSLKVTFGGQSMSTATITNPDKGFTPWSMVSYIFTPTATSQTLTFLASGGPSGGQPPFTLLDGVSLMSAAPEPMSWAMFVGGFGLVGWTMRRQRQTVSFAS